MIENGRHSSANWKLEHIRIYLCTPNLISRSVKKDRICLIRVFETMVVVAYLLLQ